MKKNVLTSLMLLTVLLGLHFKTKAQLSVNGQLRTRTEFRNGQGAPLSKGLKPAMFTSQRSRLNLLFNSYRLKMNVTLQDVRVWGQDASLINRTTTADNNGVMLHEAWAEILLTDTALKQKSLNLKIGRQELVYDDQRLLGNLDWLQQGRRHDAAVLKFEQNNWMVHLGGGFNQNKEKSAGTIYDNTPAGNYTASTNGAPMYKSMEFLYAGRKIGKGKLSFLFFSDQFNPYRMDSVGSGVAKTFTTGTWTRATTGLFFTNSFGKLDITASAYHQFGKNGAGNKINGQLYSLSGFYTPRKLGIGAGADITTARFDPLYGTPHKFWGLMDYFYVASPFGNHGLADYYIKTKLKTSDRLLIAADFHYFTAISGISGFSKTYGQEIDLVGSYNLTKEISFEAGYSHFFSTAALSSPTVKNIPNAKNQADWAYLMINIRPSFLFK